MLKLIAHPHRLMILCLLAESEHNVTELVETLGINQTAVSNHLAKLRSEGVVDYTRYHRVLQYRLVSPEVRAVLDVIGAQCLHKDLPKGQPYPAVCPHKTEEPS
ncbi:MAG: metalloregulator ArsR/SmtB family transcription factor [Neisseria sp.]|nr:metalloregulator ArsR/SmtB family transcription factor [Neisseria sp.]